MPVLKRLFQDDRGFTLAEMSVVLTILTLALTFVGNGVFQVLSTERTWRPDVVATRELRHAGSWLAGDVLNAVTTNLVSDAPAVSSMTITYKDKNNLLHTITYSISGTELIRSDNGAQIILARRVVSATYSRSGRVLTFNVQVNAAQGKTEAIQLKTYMRVLQ